MYKMIFAFLCGFFTYGMATHVVPVHAIQNTALVAPASSPAAAQSLLGVDAKAPADRLLPVYVPGQGADASCADPGRVCAWSI